MKGLVLLFLSISMFLFITFFVLLPAPLVSWHGDDVGAKSDLALTPASRTRFPRRAARAKKRESEDDETSASLQSPPRVSAELIIENR